MLGRRFPRFSGSAVTNNSHTAADLRCKYSKEQHHRGAPATTNMAFGGDDWRTLYFTSRNHLGSVNVKIPGLPVPTQKR